jgi:hypothetical protein
MVSIGNIAEASAGIVGGLLALISLRMNFYAQTGVAFLAIPAAILLVEPARHERLKIFTFRAVLHVVRDSLFINQKLRTNIFLSAVIGTATLTMAWFAQPYFKHIGLPLNLYGLLWTTLNLIVGLAAMIAYRIEARLGARPTVLALAILIPAGYIIMSGMQSAWALIVLYAFYIVRGIATPVLKDYIHRLSRSEVRATVLSVRNFIIRLCFVLVGPAMGMMTDRMGLEKALLYGGMVFLALGILLAFFFRRYNGRSDVQA